MLQTDAMTRYLLNRLLISIPTLLAISVVIFGILALAPGDPMMEFATNPSITAEVRENIRRALGLDQPLAIRYFKWLWAFLQGDMGYSFTSRSPVVDLIFQQLPATLWVVGSAYGLGLILALPLGMVSALKRYTLLDQCITLLSFVGFSLPVFFTSSLAIVIFTVWLDWLPFIYDSTLTLSDWRSLIAQIRQSLMPVMVLALWQAALLMRFIRAAILEQIHQDYVRTAHAKGLPSRTVLNRHVLRNALIPVVTLVALDVPKIFTGAIIVEQIFRVPGIGALLIDSILRGDTPVVMAITFIYAILIVVFNIVADLLYGWLDPRVRYTQ